MVELYNKMIEFTHTLIKHSNIQNIEILEIVHDLLVNPKLTNDNYKALIAGKIKTFGNTPTISLSYLNDNHHSKKDIFDKRVCKVCGEEYNRDYFTGSFDKRVNTYRTSNICKFCLNKQNSIRNKKLRKLQKETFGKIIDNTINERVKKYWKKQKENLGDAYIKRLLLRYKKYSKKDINEQLITQKRTEIKILRNQNNWRTCKNEKI